MNVIRFQVRYGQHWAPVHPTTATEGVLTEILLGPGEVFYQLKAASDWIVDAMQFTSNFKTFPKAGNDIAFTKTVPLHGLLYFSGACKSNTGLRVSMLTAHRDTCEPL